MITLGPGSAWSGDIVQPSKLPDSRPPGGYTSPSNGSTASITTDREVYLPGELVLITGTGFAGSEPVELKIRLDDGTYTSAWTVNTYSDGDLASYWTIPSNCPLGDKLTTEAGGLTSGKTATASFASSNTVLSWRSLVPDSVCPDGYFDVCICLKQLCDFGLSEPLAGRPVILYFTSGDCGVGGAAIIADTVETDADGLACTFLTAPSPVGQYSLRARYEGEPAPAPCPMPGNNACDPYTGIDNERCIALSEVSMCHAIHVTNSTNHAPTIDFGTNVSIDMCIPVEICITYEVSDPEGVGGLYEENLSGFGRFDDIVNGIYITPESSGVYVIIAKTTDPCGLSDFDTVIVSIDLNDPPSIAFEPYPPILCTPPPGPICLSYTTSDPDGLAGSHEYLVSGPGTISTETNKVCFLPTGAGLYSFVIEIVDTCLIADYDTIDVEIHSSSPPTISFGPDTTPTLCQPGQVCVPYVVSDPDGLAGLVESQVAGPGTIDTANNRICFQAATSGSHTIIARVEDPCGNVDVDTIVVNVAVGAPPTIAFGANYGTGSCTPEQICVPYTVSDPQGLAGLLEALVSGPAGAIIDSANNRVCFTPPGSGVYTIIARVTDPCGAEDRDTISVTVTINQPPVIAFGPDSTVRQCELSEICITYAVTDPNGTAGHVESLVSGPPGATINTAANRVCFTPTAPGSYTIICKVKDPCNVEDRDTCVVSVSVNTPPISIAPNDTTIYLCDLDTVCITQWAEVDIDRNIEHIFIPFGWMEPRSVCFEPDTSGYYTVVCCVFDSCGEFDCDTAIAHIILNSPPVCQIPNDTVITACEVGTLCRPVSASDPDGNLDTCEIISGPGTLENGQWCYTPTGDAGFTVVIRCVDSCGESCEGSFDVSFDLNSPPRCEFVTPAPPICLPDTAFVPFSVTDPEGKLDTCIITEGPGWLEGTTWFYEPDPGERVDVTICCYDECGDSCCVSFSITYPTPQPPVCNIPTSDTGFSFCTPTEVCIPISATSPSPPVTCIVVDGPGAIVDGDWCYTPAGTEVDTVTVRCTDICGEFCEGSFIVRFDQNRPPVIALDADFSLEFCPDHDTVCVGYTVGDPDGMAGLIETLVTGPAGADIDTANNRICFEAAGAGSVMIVARVADPCGVTDVDTVVVTVTPSTPPVCSLPGNTIVRLCQLGPICLPVSATGDDLPITCSVTAGPGSVIDGNWCFTPTGPGIYNVTITCTDACGATCSGSFQVDVRLNGIPTVAFGNDSSLFQCAPTLICVPYSPSDPDSPPKWTETLECAPAGAVIDSVLNRVCFTPPSAGIFDICVRITDSCGATDADTIKVTVNLNDPPTVQFGPDSSVFQCIPSPICVTYAVSDLDGLTGHIETKVSGPGTIDAANDRICFTPTGSGMVTIIVRVTDPCGLEDSDTINVDVRLNRPPECNLPGDTTIFLCGPVEVCLPVSATDPDNNLSQCMLMSGPGTVSNGQWCFTPAGDQQVTVTIRCADSCSAFCEESFDVNFIINDPPVCQVPNDINITMACSLVTVSLPVGASDPNGNLRECLITAGPGTLEDGVWSYLPPGPGEYCVTIQCRDSCDAICEETFCVGVDLSTIDCDCIYKISVGGGEPVSGLNGEAVVVPIVLEIADVDMGGFDLLLCYDATGVSLTQVVEGPSLAAAEWEYFTYRLGAYGNCVGECPTGIVSLVALAERDGNPGTTQSSWKPLGAIANLTFVITGDRNFINLCIPVRWCWYECADNAISSRTGDTTFIEIGYEFDSCQSNPKSDPIPGICFEDGLICILEPPDDRGDLNLNGIANEIGDAVLYTNFFIYGHSVWNPTYKDVQILASDINDDGYVLTIADLVYLIRIITGDVQPYPPNPKAVTSDPVVITIDAVGEALALRWNSPMDIGGAYFIIELPQGAQVGEVTLSPEIANMKLRTHRDGGQLRLLVFSDTTEIIPAGSYSILSVAMDRPNEASVSIYDLATSDGWVMPAILGAAKASLPTEFTLAQNYPNPFNAGTVIRFGTEQATDYTVSIYDILGRRVWSTSGHTDAGWVEVSWDGRNDDGRTLASGLYLYRVETAKAVQTRKMTLLK